MHLKIIGAGKFKIVAHCNVKPRVNKRQFIGFNAGIFE